MDAISFVLGERPSHLRVKKLSVSINKQFFGILFDSLLVELYNLMSTSITNKHKFQVLIFYYFITRNTLLHAFV